MRAMDSCISCFSRRTASGRYKNGGPRVLVTGFGPFPDTPFNASQALVQDLAENRNAYCWGKHVYTAVLPTHWTQAPLEAGRVTQAIKPDVILHLGVSSQTNCFEIESRAFNVARYRADCSGCFPASHYVQRDGSPILSATLPVHLIRSKLRLAKIPANLSKDAGRYLCNAIFYQSLSKVKATGRPVMAGFIHIPALSAYDIHEPVSSNVLCGWTELKTGLGIIIKTMIVYARERQRHTMRLAGNPLKGTNVESRRGEL